MIGKTAPYKTEYFSFQGRVMIGARTTTPDTDGDGLVAPLYGLYQLGNVPAFNYDVASDVETVQDSYSGLRQTDFRQSMSDKIEISLDLKDAGPIAMAIAHRGTWHAIRAGSISDGYVIGNPTGRQWIRAMLLPILYIDYYIGERRADGSYAPLRNINHQTLLIKDSSPTPKTLTNVTNFALDIRTGRIVFHDITTGGPYVAPLSVNTTFGTVSDTLSSAIAYNVVFPLTHQNITQFQIQDSSATPRVVDSSYYILDPVYGELTWLASKRAALEADAFTFPLRAVYNHGAARSLSMMSAPLDTEWWMRLAGVNTANNNAPFLADFYRVQFSPVTGAQMIHERTGTLPLKATALADPYAKPDGILGRVGRIVQM